MPVLNAGAKGYILKTASSADNCSMLFKVAAWRASYPRQGGSDERVEYHRNHHGTSEELTAREQGSFNALLRDMKNQHVQMSIFISWTVRPMSQYACKTESVIVPRQQFMLFLPSGGF